MVGDHVRAVRACSFQTAEIGIPPRRTAAGTARGWGGRARLARLVKFVATPIVRVDAAYVSASRRGAARSNQSGAWLLRRS